MKSVTVREEESGDREDMLVTVFQDGEMVKTWSWEEVKARAAGRQTEGS